MVRMRYVGGANSVIGYMSRRPIELKSYGQRVELTEDQARDAIRGRVALLTEEEFDALLHTPEELKKYARFESHLHAPPEFLDRRSKAWSKVLENYKASTAPATEVQKQEVTYA